ncbi:YjcB protein [Salmonella enterica subsp. enterica serovar Typhimurium]|nr:YjcB protein [Salmonella enterica subsp. enterica serovar Typhimurium]
MMSVDSQNVPRFPGTTPCCPGQRSIQRKCFMAAITTGVVLLRWQLLSAVLMFLASTLNIRFRKSDYIGLAVISSGLGVVSACWFATGLLGITMMDLAAIWHNIEAVMVETMSQTPPEWPMVLT